MIMFFCLMLAATAGALQKRSEVRLLCQCKDTEPGFMQLLLYTMRLFFYLMLAATAGALQKRSEGYCDKM
jgi:hypothetical protein